MKIDRYADHEEFESNRQIRHDARNVRRADREQSDRPNLEAAYFRAMGMGR